MRRPPLAHPEHMAFLKRCVERYPDHAKGRVLEFGSYDVNGASRAAFPDAAAYVGVDHRKGPGVDVVGLFHEFYADEPFDVFLCCNTLEHDPHWTKTLAAGFSLLRPGGIFILTVPHGYPEHEVTCSPKDGYYQNIRAGDLFERMPHGAPMDFTELREPPETHVVGVMP